MNVLDVLNADTIGLFCSWNWLSNVASAFALRVASRNYLKNVPVLTFVSSGLACVRHSLTGLADKLNRMSETPRRTRCAR